METKKSTILIVDDEETNVELLAELLSQKYTIKVGYDGQQALDILEKFPDIEMLLLDIEMPKLNGFEVASKLKKNERTKDIPFIFLTSHIDKEFIQKGFELGAKDYIKKPINIDELFIRIATHLENFYLQKEVEKQKQEFETIFNHAGDGIVKIDFEGNFLTINNAFLELTGYTEKEIFSKNYFEMIVPELQKESRSELQQIKETKHVHNIEKEYIVNNGRLIVNISASLLPDNKSLLLIIKNTTLLKLQEEQARLASMGEMIGNIAHQWRQPLSIISVSASSLKMHILNDLELTQEYMINTADTIVRQTKYLSSIIDHFRDFIKGENQFMKISIKEVIDTTLELVDATLKNNYINVITDYPEDLIVFGNKNELSEAFINIINNSKDILKESIEEPDDRLLFISTKLIDPSTIVIKFKDSGGGIEEKILPRVFEPYFTSKHQSIGTGLGLSIADKIIRQKHQGSIKAYNETFEYNNTTYKGACFEIVLHADKKKR